MSDFISSQAALEALEKMHQGMMMLAMKINDDRISARVVGCMDAIAGMRIRIENLPSAEPEQQKWIPVTERLPEGIRDGFSDDVLLLIENPDGDITWRDSYVGYYLYDAGSDETGWWVKMTCDCAKVGEHKYGDNVYKANEYVTHWMPLPEPPKEEA